MKKVLITGATGFIGRHALESLITNGTFEIHAVSSRKLSSSQTSGCMWHEANLLDYEQVKELVQAVRPTYLLHFAWYSIPKKYWTALENFFWVQSSLELLKQFKECGGQRVVMSGTCAEYDWENGYCSEFETPRTPVSPYGICKNALQEMVDSFAKETGLSSAWGRIFFLFGPFEHQDRLIASVIRSILQGKPVVCHHGNYVRDFLYVQDVADAFATLLESDVTGPVNIASGQPISLKEFINKIGEKTGRQDLIEFAKEEASPNEPTLLVADNSKLKSKPGWLPQFDIDRGLDLTIEWWKKKLIEYGV